MHGSASGLIEAFQTYYAGPGSGVANAASWAEIPAPPAGFFKYGSGGIAGCATLCGVPNGACAVLGMIGASATISKQVMQFYAYTSFPTDDLCGETAPWPGTAVPVTPPDPMDDDTEVLAHTIANVPICHASISKWCYAAGVSLGSKDTYGRVHKNDRCGKVCAEIAAYTAKLINGSTTNGSSYTSDPVYQAIVPGYTLPVAVQDCRGCHTKASDPTKYPAQISEMDCQTCHGDYLSEFHAAAALTIQDAWVSKQNNVVKNGYYPGQSVRYHVTFSVNNRGSSFVRNINSKAKGPTASGTWTDKLLKKETLGSGPHEFKYDKVIDANALVGSKGTLVMRLTAADYVGGPVVAQDERIVKFNVVAPY